MTKPSVPAVPIMSKAKAESILEKIGGLMDDLVAGLAEAGLPRELAEVHVVAQVRRLCGAVDGRPPRALTASEFQDAVGALMASARNLEPDHEPGQ